MVANRSDCEWWKRVYPVRQADEFPDDKCLAAMGLSKDSPIADFSDRLIWGMYGRPAQMPEQWKKLRDLGTEHLENILITQRRIPLIYSRAIMLILRERHIEEVKCVS